MYIKDYLLALDVLTSFFFHHKKKRNSSTQKILHHRTLNMYAAEKPAQVYAQHKKDIYEDFFFIGNYFYIIQNENYADYSVEGVTL